MSGNHVMTSSSTMTTPSAPFGGDTQDEQEYQQREPCSISTDNRAAVDAEQAARATATPVQDRTSAGGEDVVVPLHRDDDETENIKGEEVPAAGAAPRTTGPASKQLTTRSPRPALHHVPVPLKDRPNHVDLVREVSDTIYFRGISPKFLTDENLIELLNHFRPVREIDLAERRTAGSGSVWARYATVADAGTVLFHLHKLQFQGYFQGLGLMTSFELGSTVGSWCEEVGSSSSTRTSCTQRTTNTEAMSSTSSAGARTPLAEPNAGSSTSASGARQATAAPRFRSTVSYNPVLRRIQPLAQRELPSLKDWLRDRATGQLDVTGRSAASRAAAAGGGGASGKKMKKESTQQAGLIYATPDGGKVKKQKGKDKKEKNSTASISSGVKISPAVGRGEEQEVGRREKNVVETSSDTSPAAPAGPLTAEKRRSSSKDEKAQRGQDTCDAGPNKQKHYDHQAGRQQRIGKGERNAAKPVLLTTPKAFKWGFHTAAGDVAGIEDGEEQEDQDSTAPSSSSTRTASRMNEDESGKDHLEQEIQLPAASSKSSFQEGETNKDLQHQTRDQPPHTKDHTSSLQAAARKQAPASSKNVDQKQKQTAIAKQSPPQKRQLVKNPQVALFRVQDMQYQQKAFVINKETKYPMPTGVYGARVLRECRALLFQNYSRELSKSLQTSRALLRRIGDVDLLGGLKNYDKEISESMAMVDAVERGLRLLTLSSPHALRNVNVFVLGDGKYALTACCLRAFLGGERSSKKQEVLAEQKRMLLRGQKGGAASSSSSSRSSPATATVENGATEPVSGSVGGGSSSFWEDVEQNRHDEHRQEAPLCAQLENIEASSRNFEQTWRWFSIDPIMEVERDLLDNVPNFHQCPLMSQDFDIPAQLRTAGCEETAVRRFQMNADKTAFEEDIGTKIVCEAVDSSSSPVVFDKKIINAHDVEERQVEEEFSGTTGNKSSASGGHDLQPVNKMQDHVANVAVDHEIIMNADEKVARNANHGKTATSTLVTEPSVSCSYAGSRSSCSYPKNVFPDSSEIDGKLTIVVACHSHAPLREFWHRVPKPKICATLPCCENYSDLGVTPDLQYDDFEVFTPKRRVRLYRDI
ncbi:unnamed protein product [Amoebophrya sp. A120]|nr:unnamed protein product [Amoebophrya sp. A120]|eukprot:GSA120T00023474001.1